MVTKDKCQQKQTKNALYISFHLTPTEIQLIPLPLVWKLRDILFYSRSHCLHFFSRLLLFCFEDDKSTTLFSMIWKCCLHVIKCWIHNSSIYQKSDSKFHGISICLEWKQSRPNKSLLGEFHFKVDTLDINSKCDKLIELLLITRSER